MDDKIKLLKNIGLTDKESAVYLTLLEFGPLLIAEISRRAEIHRPDVYKILPVLQAKSLVTIAPRGKQKRFTAEPPAKVELILGSIKSDFDKLLPALNELRDRSSQRPVIRFLEGDQGMRFILGDLITVLKRGEVYYRFSSRRACAEIEKYVPLDYRAKRDAKQLERFLITDGLTDNQKKNPTLNRIYKIISPERGLFNDNVVQLIYKNRVVFADLNSVTAILIENDTIAEFQKRIFKILFELL